MKKPLHFDSNNLKVLSGQDWIAPEVFFPPGSEEAKADWLNNDSFKSAVRNVRVQANPLTIPEITSQSINAPLIHSLKGREYFLTFEASTWNGYQPVKRVGRETSFSGNFISPNCTNFSTSLNIPSGVSVCPISQIRWIADLSNNRVLGFSGDNFSRGAIPTVVLGQPDFIVVSSGTTSQKMNSPQRVFVDEVGTLWVADSGNNRVLRFDRAWEKTSGSSADGVLGQQTFTSSSPTTTQSGMNNPIGIGVSREGVLWVADRANNRVLKFENAQAKPNGANADVVLGQTGFTVATAAATQSGMNNPRGVFIDQMGTLWVVETVNSRILRFDFANSLPNGANASAVLGQANFTSSSGTTTQTGLSAPSSITIDNSNTLWVSDSSNNRILGYFNAHLKQNGGSADRVLGQSTFTTATSGITESSMNSPQGIYSFNNFLYVTDTANNRLLIFNGTNTISSGANASDVIGQPNFTSTAGFTTTFTPQGQFAECPLTKKVFLSQTPNNRILVYESYETFITHSSPISVLGQWTFTGISAQNGQAGLTSPRGIHVDANGTLWVADSGNHRILGFQNAAMKTIGAGADFVLGQPDFWTYTSGNGHDKLNTPSSVFVDIPREKLWIADSGNNRVLRYHFNHHINAEQVFGQSAFGTSTSGTTATTMNNPRGVHVSANGTLWVADKSNNRILGFNNAHLVNTNGSAANVVLGQADFVSGSANRGTTTGQNTLSGPSSVSGYLNELFVFDRMNNRILRYTGVDTITSGANAAGVLIQTTFTATAAVTGFDNQPENCHVYVSPDGIIMLPQSRRSWFWSANPTSDVAIGANSIQIKKSETVSITIKNRSASTRAVTFPNTLVIDGVNHPVLFESATKSIETAANRRRSIFITRTINNQILVEMSPEIRLNAS